MAQPAPCAILIVDDEPSILSPLTTILSRQGYTVTTAENGALAWEHLHTQVFDVILCDLRMPGMDGPTFYTMLLRYYPFLASRVIFLTGDTWRPATMAFLDQCDQPWLPKPFTPVDLLHSLAEMLGAA